MPKITKEARIKQELQRLQVKFELIDGNQREVVAQLIQNAAFMAITLQDLQEEINAQGVVDSYKNGREQYGQKPSAAVQSYNALIKNYTAVIKTLAALVPPERKQPANPLQTIQDKINAGLDEAEKEKQKRINAEIAAAQAELDRRRTEHPGSTPARP